MPASSRWRATRPSSSSRRRATWRCCVEAAARCAPARCVVPFGAAWHDWAALELGAWVARATGAPLRLIGAASDGRRGRARREPPARRRVADRPAPAGIVAEPLLAAPGATACARSREGAGLLVVGLSDRWREEGLGRVRTRLADGPPAPTVLVRRGPRPGRARARRHPTRFAWSLTASAP